MLVTSYFSFSHNVFEWHIHKGHQKSLLCGNGKLFTKQQNFTLVQTEIIHTLDHKKNVTQELKLAFGREEAFVGKGKQEGHDGPKSLT